MRERVALMRRLVAEQGRDPAEFICVVQVWNPPADPEALAAACFESLQRPAAERRAVGRLARRSICTRFSIQNMTREYEQVYHTELEARRASRAASAAVVR